MHLGLTAEPVGTVVIVKVGVVDVECVHVDLLSFSQAEIRC
jgi:hypothetical protein